MLSNTLLIVYSLVNKLFTVICFPGEFCHGVNLEHFSALLDVTVSLWLTAPSHTPADLTGRPPFRAPDLHVVQQDPVPQLHAQRGQHQVSRDVVVVGQSGPGEVAAQRDGVQQQLLQLFGHHGGLRLVQTHVHRVGDHISWDQTLIVLQRRRRRRR